jgi:hypothetical protein
MEKKLALALAVIAVFMLVGEAGAIRIQDNLYFSVPKDGYENVILVLPDDLGLVTSTGNINYVVRSTASSAWDNIEESLSLTTTDEGVLIVPIEFSGFGKSIGECSKNFRISVSSPLIGTREWNAGVCVSQYRDVDTGSEGDDPWDALNSNTDYFDIGFESDVIYADAAAGEIIQATLFLQSYADLTLDVRVKSSGVAVSPTEDTVKLSEGDPQKSLIFVIQDPPMESEYELEIEATMKDCEGAFCKKTAKTRLVFGKDKGFLDKVFSISLFPSNINVKELVPVNYQLTIYNPGKMKAINVTVEVPDELSSDLQKKELSVLEAQSKTINFTVIPTVDFGSYEVKVSAEYRGSVKKDTSELSVNEMLSDAMRESGLLMESADSETRSSLSSAMQEWSEKYQNTAYGNEIDDYNSLKAKFDEAKQAQETPPQPNGDSGEDDYTYVDEPEGFPLLWIIVIAVVVAAVAIVLYKLKFSSRGEESLENAKFEI